jgi:hypothetical protein
MVWIAELLVADEPEAWRECGFTVDDDGVCQIGTVRVRLDPTAADKGVVSWALHDAPEGTTNVDGLTTTAGAVTEAPPPVHKIGAEIIDHLVVLSPDVVRTVSVLEGLGLPLRGMKDSDTYGRPMRQAFFRMGEVILEVVGGPEPDPRGGPARFYGLALTMASLDDAKSLLGDRMGTPKPAAQEGRLITTIHADLRVPVALMSA